MKRFALGLSLLAAVAVLLSALGRQPLAGGFLEARCKLPGRPAAIAPGAGAEVGLRPTFEWSNVKGARSYRLEVATNLSSQPAADVKLPGARRRFKLERPLEAGTRYVWHVRATNDCGPGPWSSPRRFRTEAPAPPPGPDQSDVSFVDNLLVKVEAGEWTLGEGLVATLKLFAGELDAASVLRHPDLINYEGTGILEMAHEYLDQGPDAQAKAEIRRLLGLLVFSKDQLEAMAGLGPATAAPPGRFAPGAALGPEEDCLNFFSGYGELPPGVGQCLEAKSSGVLDILYGAGRYRVFAPAASLPQAGWDEEDYLLALNAMEDAVPKFKELGELPPVNLVFSVTKEGSTWAAAYPTPGEPCGVVVYTSVQGLSDGEFKQVIAHELAHCFQEDTFTKQNRVDYEFRKWREEGLADYLSNAVYPQVNLEWRVLDQLAQAELTTTLFDRSYSNSLFFQYLYHFLDDEGIFQLVRRLPTSGGRPQQEAALAAYPGMDEIYHDFARAMTDGQIEDTGGGLIPYRARSKRVDIEGEATPLLKVPTLRPFGVSRLRLVISDTKQADLAFRSRGLTIESARPAGGGSWREVPARLPDEDFCHEQITVVVTTVEPDAGFELDVTEVRDLPDLACDPCLMGGWAVNNQDLAELYSDALEKPVSVTGRLTAVYRDGEVDFTWSRLTSSYEYEDASGKLRRHTSVVDGGGTQSYSTRFGKLLVFGGPELTPEVTDITWYGEKTTYTAELDTWVGDVYTNQLYECQGDRLVIAVPGRSGSHEIKWTRFQ